MAISINQQVVSPKYGQGVITKIITKSTGYVEVLFENGLSKKEMAFNLTDLDGNSLKNKPESKNKTSEKLKITASGSFDSLFSSNEEKQAWLEKREKAKRDSVSW